MAEPNASATFSLLDLAAVSLLPLDDGNRLSNLLLQLVLLTVALSLRASMPAFCGSAYVSAKPRPVRVSRAGGQWARGWVPLVEPEPEPEQEPEPEPGQRDPALALAPHPEPEPEPELQRALQPRVPPPNLTPPSASGARARGVPAAGSASPPPLWQTCASGHFRAPIDLPTDLVQAARAKLGETPRVKFEALAALRQRIAAETSKGARGGGGKRARRLARSDDQFLLAFLRAKRFDVTKAYDQLIRYTELSAEVGAADPEVQRAGGCEHDDMAGMDALGLLELMPGCASDGSRLGLVIGSRFNEEMLASLDGDRALRYLLWMFSRLASDPYCQVHGFTMVEDLQNTPLMASVRFAKGIETGTKRRMLRLVQSAVPIRFVGFYLVNPPSQLGAVLALARPFLARKMRKRIVLASTVLLQVQRQHEQQQRTEAKAKAGNGGGNSGLGVEFVGGEMDAVASVVGRAALPESLEGLMSEEALVPSWWEQVQRLLQQQRQQRHGAAAVASGGLSSAEELGILLE